MGLGGSFSACFTNDDYRGSGAKHCRGFGCSCSSYSAMQRHPPPPPSQQTQLSSPLNQSRCLFNYWEQRGSLTNSFSQPQIAPSLAFLSSSLCHSLRLDFSLTSPSLVLSLSLSPSFTLLSSLPAPFVLHCIFIFMDSNHSSSFFFFYFFFFFFFLVIASVSPSPSLAFSAPEPGLPLFTQKNRLIHRWLLWNITAVSRQPSLPEPHAIFRGDDIRFLLMKKKQQAIQTAL